MYDEPITTVAEAKEFFVAMGCSGFHMSREHPARYDEYTKLNIPKELETEWRQEQLDIHLTEIIEAKDYSTLWMLHSSMAELVEELRTPDAVLKMWRATRYMHDRVPLSDGVMVSETINGRRDRRFRGGLIYLSYDLQSSSMAKEFAKLAIHFARYVEGNTKDWDRCQKATQACNEIVAELEL